VNMVILALFYFYVGMMWHEWERFFATLLKSATPPEPKGGKEVSPGFYSPW